MKPQEKKEKKEKKGKDGEKEEDDEESEEEEKKAKQPEKTEKGEKKEIEGSRGNHQRLQAIELYAALIKASQNNKEGMKMLGQNFALLTAVIIKVIQTAETWQQKKVKKTGQCVGLFVKAAKAIKQDKSGESDEFKQAIVDQGAKLTKELTDATDKDKAMSNLKGKVKEIKALSESV